MSRKSKALSSSELYADMSKQVTHSNPFTSCERGVQSVAT